MLRAAWVGQELLTTFSTGIGEVALIPATGGLFSVTLTYEATTSQGSEVREVLLWDRKTEGGFPEAKILKQKLRDHIEPERDLGHSDKKPHVRASETFPDHQEALRAAGANGSAAQKNNEAETDASKNCEDCA